MGASTSQEQDPLFWQRFSLSLSEPPLLYLYEKKTKREYVLRKVNVSNEQAAKSLKNRVVKVSSRRCPQIQGAEDCRIKNNQTYCSSRLEVIILAHVSSHTLLKQITQRLHKPSSFKLFEEDQLWELASSVTLALKTFQQEGVQYTSLRSHNILLDQEGGVKLLDPVIKNDSDNIIDWHSSHRTHIYPSPEELRGDRSHSTRSQLFSLGMIMLQSGCLQFSDTLYYQSSVDWSSLSSRVNKFQKKYSSQLTQLVKRLLDQVPSERPTLNQLTKKQFFSAEPFKNNHDIAFENDTRSTLKTNLFKQPTVVPNTIEPQYVLRPPSQIYHNRPSFQPAPTIRLQPAPVIYETSNRNYPVNTVFQSFKPKQDSPIRIDDSYRPVHFTDIPSRISPKRLPVSQPLISKPLRNSQLSIRPLMLEDQRKQIKRPTNVQVLQLASNNYKSPRVQSKPVPQRQFIRPVTQVQRPPQLFVSEFKRPLTTIDSAVHRPIRQLPLQSAISQKSVRQSLPLFNHQIQTPFFRGSIATPHQPTRLYQRQSIVQPTLTPIRLRALDIPYNNKSLNENLTYAPRITTIKQENQQAGNKGFKSFGRLPQQGFTGVNILDQLDGVTSPINKQQIFSEEDYNLHYVQSSVNQLFTDNTLPKDTSEGLQRARIQISDQMIYDGYLKNGKFQGQGNLLQEGKLMIQGTFKEGKPFGQCTIYNLSEDERWSSFEGHFEGKAIRGKIIYNHDKQEQANSHVIQLVNDQLKTLQ